MAQAGYDPNAAVTVWEKMNKVMGNNSSTSLLSTHPSNDARIKALKKMLPEVLPVYEQAKQNKLTMQKRPVSQSKNTQGSGARKGTTKKKSRS